MARPELGAPAGPGVGTTPPGDAYGVGMSPPQDARPEPPEVNQEAPGSPLQSGCAADLSVVLGTVLVLIGFGLAVAGVVSSAVGTGAIVAGVTGFIVGLGLVVAGLNRDDQAMAASSQPPGGR